MQFIVEGYPAYAYTGGRPFAASERAVVFVHGAAFDHSVWQWQSRYFAWHGLPVLALDLPAHGRSPGAIRTSVESLARWLLAFLDAAGLARATLLRRRSTWKPPGDTRAGCSSPRAPFRAPRSSARAGGSTVARGAACSRPTSPPAPPTGLPRRRLPGLRCRRSWSRASATR